MAEKIQHDLSPSAKVEQHLKLQNVDSGALREIDIAVTVPAGQFSLFVAIDCKDYSENVDIKDLEAFAGLLKDVRANKGPMIAALLRWTEYLEWRSQTCPQRMSSPRRR